MPSFAAQNRFLKMAVAYKKKIGFKGTLLLEPKPQVCVHARVAVCLVQAMPA
jgi:xylose isomerase